MPGSSARTKLLLALAAILAACAKDSPTAPATRLAFGDWGGNHAQVVATDSVTEVTYICTSGEFAGNIPLDVMGRFAVNGSFYPYAGPISGNGPMPAQFSGLVEGNTLTFAIAVSDTVEHRVISLGPQVVVLGEAANIVVCPG
ncbi:MAG: hypothetical protein ACHQSE_03075 [Gemmatimonadales bacterium]